MSVEKDEKSVSIDKLYELSDDVKRKEWLDDWLNFMHRIGKPVTRIPIMAKQVLDLYELYRLVVQHGGLVEIINKKLWREITKGLNLPNSITSAAFTLRTQYQKYLYDYECEHENLSCLNDLQAAIEGNRREGRRTNPSDGTDNSPSQTLNCSGGGSVSRAHLLTSRTSANDPSEGMTNGTSAMMAAAAAASGFSYPFIGATPHPMVSFFGKNSFNGKDELIDLGNAMANQQSSLVQRQFEFFQKAAIDAMVASNGNGQNGFLSNGNFNNGGGSGRNSSTSSYGESDINSRPARNSAKKARLERSTTESLTNFLPKTSGNLEKMLNTPLTTNMKLTNSKTENGENSMVVSMEVNGVVYEGVLFPSITKSQTKTTSNNSTVHTSKPTTNPVQEFSKLIQHINEVANAAASTIKETTINNNIANNDNQNKSDVSDCSSKEEKFIFEDDALTSDMHLSIDPLDADCDRGIGIDGDDILATELTPVIPPLSEITNACE